MAKPKLSGIFAAVIGAGCLGAAMEASTLSHISPTAVFATWLVLSGVTLLGWGLNRALGSSKIVVGQPTIVMVATVLGITFAIWAVVVSKNS